MDRKELRELEPANKDTRTRKMWKIMEMIPLYGTSKYSVHDRFNVAMTWVICGSLKKTEKKTGISRRTITEWSKTDWWPEVTAACADLAIHQYGGKLFSVMERALEALEERLEEGDVVMTKDGLQTIPIKAKDLMNIAAQAGATRAKIQDSAPEEKSQGSSTNKKLLDLSMALAMVAQQSMQNKGTSPPDSVSNSEDSNIIDAEFTETPGE